MNDKVFYVEIIFIDSKGIKDTYNFYPDRVFTYNDIVARMETYFYEYLRRTKLTGSLKCYADIYELEFTYRKKKRFKQEVYKKYLGSTNEREAKYTSVYHLGRTLSK